MFQGLFVPGLIYDSCREQRGHLSHWLPVSVTEEFWCLSPCSFYTVIYQLSPRLLKLYLINISEVSATPSHSVPHKPLEKDSSSLPKYDLKQNTADTEWKKCTTSNLHLKVEKGISVQSEQTCQRVSSISEKSS